MAEVLLCAKTHGVSSRLATALQSLRIDVIMAVEGDPAFDATALDQAARGADAVLALWSNGCFPHGGDVSGFVRRAAAVGRKRGVLISTMAEPTALDPPWNEKPAKPLLTWANPSGNRTEAAREWRALVRDLGAALHRPNLDAYVAAHDSRDDTALQAWAKANPKDPLAADIIAKTQVKRDMGVNMVGTRAAPLAAQETARAGDRARRPAAWVRGAAFATAGLAATALLGAGLFMTGQGPQAAEASTDGAAPASLGLTTARRWLGDWIGGLGAASQSPEAVEIPANAEFRGSAGPPPPADHPQSLSISAAEDEEAIALIILDSRAVPPHARAPIVRDPSRLPDFAAFRECEACPDMVVLPAGMVMLGSPAGEPGRNEDEDSRRGAGGAPIQASVPRFAIARFETTWDQWNACVAAGACDNAAIEEAGGHNGWGAGRRPLIEVNGESEPAAYAAFISSRTGATYRLPSEVEWEYAARAGTATAYPWGATMSRAQANYGDEECCSGGVGGADSFLNTAPVGAFPANAFGLFDMHGNVMEWVADCYRGSYGAQHLNAAVISDEACSARVLRGGSWDGAPDALRSAARMRLNPDRRFNFTGFRLARTL
jgi:formylglycine-generating enzyme required for sulfatase activity